MKLIRREGGSKGSRAKIGNKNPNYGKYGSLSSHWKGGKPLNTQGYVLNRLEPSDFFHQMANSNGYVLEHRLIVARTLGRCL